MKVIHGLVRWLFWMLGAIGLLTVIVITTPFVSWWARAYAGSIDRPRGDILIVLAAAADDAHGISYSSYWRARMAALVWRSGSFKEVVISGGGGPGILNFLAAEGIPRTAMVAEWKSKSTHQNAIETAHLIRNMDGKKVLLTSDFHMYRALRVFRKAGIQVTPMAVPDVLHAAESWNGRFCGFETMLLETVKIAYYELRGWM